MTYELFSQCLAGASTCPGMYAALKVSSSPKYHTYSFCTSWAIDHHPDRLTALSFLQQEHQRILGSFIGHQA